MPKLTITDLDRELRNKQLRPVYFIYGPEGYLVNTAISRIRNFVPVEPERFSKDADLSEIIACASTLPMWANHRLIIVSDAGSFKEADALERYLQNPAKTATIIFHADKADGRTKFVQLCTLTGAAIECKPLYDDKIPGWIRMEAEGRNRSISMESASIIAELVGNNLSELATALDKIVLYIGRKKMIEPLDVETVLTETGRKSVFEFTDAVGRRSLDKALHILGRLSEFGENEVMILSLIARHWRLLLKAKEAILKTPNYDRAGIARVLGVNPFFVEGYTAQAKLFSPKELKSGFRKLYSVDKALKSSRLPKKTILEKCVRELIKNQAAS